MPAGACYRPLVRNPAFTMRWQSKASAKVAAPLLTATPTLIGLGYAGVSYEGSILWCCNVKQRLGRPTPPRLAAILGACIRFGGAFDCLIPGEEERLGILYGTFGPNVESVALSYAGSPRLRNNVL